MMRNAEVFLAGVCAKHLTYPPSADELRAGLACTHAEQHRVNLFDLQERVAHWCIAGLASGKIANGHQRLGQACKAFLFEASVRSPKAGVCKKYAEPTRRVFRAKARISSHPLTCSMTELLCTISKDGLAYGSAQPSPMT